MTKEEIVQHLNAVIGALNTISVSGKANLTNLSGSISVLEAINSAIIDLDISIHSDSE